MKLHENTMKKDVKRMTGVERRDKGIKERRDKGIKERRDKGIKERRDKGIKERRDKDKDMK